MITTIIASAIQDIYQVAFFYSFPSAAIVASSLDYIQVSICVYGDKCWI